ncbi:hypothetical protein J5N97_009674 [Dioscorea zingiberensis]|uniref:TF-B3 domain-containing protein n=1 Tax=Dioscorea zingiberensis TaxID=325984 RepID=A0A9D5CYN6_9LILI|nr:hypothetical protein J5N97_009674 [Dioscorea zingiberensis]
MKARVSKLEEENKKLTGEKESIIADFGKSQRALSSLKADYESLQASLSLSEQTVTTLRLDLDQSRSEKDSIVGENKKLSEKVSALERGVSTEQEMRKALRAKLTTIEELVIKLQEDNRFLSEQLGAKNNLLSQAQNEVLIAQESNEVIKKEMSSLQSDLNESWRKSVELEAKLAAAKKKELSDDEIRRVTSEVYSILSCVHSVDPSVNFYQTSYDAVVELYFEKCHGEGEGNKDPIAEEIRVEDPTVEEARSDVPRLEEICVISASEKNTSDMAIAPSSVSDLEEVSKCKMVILDPDPIYKAIIAKSKSIREDTGCHGETVFDPEPILLEKECKPPGESSQAIIEIEDEAITAVSVVPSGEGASESIKATSIGLNGMKASETDERDRSSTVRRKEDRPEVRQLRGEIEELKAVRDKILSERTKTPEEVAEILRAFRGNMRAFFEAGPVRLRGPSENYWSVMLSMSPELWDARFTEGWADFVRDHQLAERELLVFVLREDMCFEVHILGNNQCQKVSTLAAAPTQILDDVSDLDLFASSDSS